MKKSYLIICLLSFVFSACIGVNSCTSYGYEEKALRSCLEYQIKYLNRDLKRGGYQLKI